MDLFITHARLKPGYFYFGQSLYLLWNAFNDPLFGFLQDSAGKKNHAAALRTRFNCVRYGGVAWALAFTLIWFPPVESQISNGDGLVLPSSAFSFWSVIHFVVSICAYDAFLTLVEVSHSAILSEITVSAAERAEFNSYAAALAGIGSFSSFIGQYTWDRTPEGSLFLYRVAVSVIAGFSALIFLWSAHAMERSTTDLNNDDFIKSNIDVDVEKKQKGGNDSAFLARVFKFIRELKSQPNFWIFVLVSCVQSFDCAFEKSSFAVMLDRVSEDLYSKSTQGLIISASFFFPWLITLGLTPQIKRYGVFQVLKFIFATRMVICFGGYIYSANVHYAGPFLLINRISSELVCRISPLVLSDLVDEDRFLNKRNSSETRSGSVVGTLHFFTKVASSLGPMMSYTFLTSTLAPPSLRLSFVVIPGICVSIQFTLWTFQFGLKGAYLNKVNDYVVGSIANPPLLLEEV